MTERSETQHLIDLCFEIALIIGETGLKGNEAKAEWVARQLSANGFHTEPMGASWGVLTHKQKGKAAR